MAHGGVGDPRMGVGFVDNSSLEAFLAVADAGKFTTAADQLYLTQSALSKRISKLEDEVGVQLFRKTRGGVELTQAGWEFYGYARKSTREYHSLMDRLATFKDSQSASLRIGALPLQQEYLLEDAFSSYWVRHPDVQIDYREDSQSALLTKLKLRKLDAALVRLDLIDYATYAARPVLRDSFVVVCPATDPLARKKSVTVDQLRGAKFAMLDANSDITRRFISECDSAGFFPNISVSHSRHRMLLRAVQNGMGISVMPRKLVEAYGAPDLALVPFATEHMTTLGFAWLRVEGLSSQLKACLDEVTANLHEIRSLAPNLVEA